MSSPSPTDHERLAEIRSRVESWSKAAPHHQASQDAVFLLDLAQQALDLRAILPPGVVNDAILQDEYIRAAVQRETVREIVQKLTLMANQYLAESVSMPEQLDKIEQLSRAEALLVALRYVRGRFELK